jgi:hypothetical protein
MEKHFLKEFVSGKSRFSAKPWYNPSGDCIIYRTVDEEVVADRIDELLTIYVSAASGKPIGFQIKGVGAIVKKFGLSRIEVECEEKNKELLSVSISEVLLAAYESGPQTIGRRQAYSGAFECSPRQSSLKIAPLGADRDNIFSASSIQ